MTPRRSDPGRRLGTAGLLAALLTAAVPAPAAYAADTVLISGAVRDASGHGWPLWATVSVDGRPAATATSAPFTGAYQLRLPVGQPYTLRVQSRYPGYPELTRQIEVGTADTVVDLALPVDADACVAPGYTHRANGLVELFDTGGTTAPDGWSVLDNLGNEQVWSFDDPGERGNLTGATGGFAIAESDLYGGPARQDTALVSPVVDLTGVASPTIGFASDFNTPDYPEDAGIAEVDLSVDGGGSWSNVWHADDAVRGPVQVTLPIPQAAGQPDARIRFHYFEGELTAGDWWQVDRVWVGEHSCVPVAGGLVAGYVRDANTASPLVGATVGVAEATVSTAATGDDPRLDDGFYWMFNPSTATTQLTASMRGYQPMRKRPSVPADQTTRVNFDLPTGALTVGTAALTGAAPIGGRTTVSLDVTNTGTAPIELTVAERPGTGPTDGSVPPTDGSVPPTDATGANAATSGTSMSGANAATSGTSMSGASAATSGTSMNGASATTSGTSMSGASNGTGAPVRRISGRFSPDADGLARPAGQPAEAPQRAGVRAATAGSGWRSIADYPLDLADNAAAEYRGRIYSVGGNVDTGRVRNAYVYDPATDRWTAFAPLPVARQRPVAAFLGDRLYVTGGWSGTNIPAEVEPSLDVYDPATDTWSTGAPIPQGTAAAGAAVLDKQLYVVGGCHPEGYDCGSSSDVFRYDPVADRWDSLAGYPEPVAWVSCGAIEAAVYCAGGVAEESSRSTYRYDPITDTWTRLADLPIDLWAAGYAVADGRLNLSGGVTDDGSTITNQGFAYDPVSDAWSALPNAVNALYRGASACGFYRIGGSFARYGRAPFAEVLPGRTDCGSDRDSAWLAATPTASVLAAGRTVRLSVTLDAGVLDQPGTYSAALLLRGNTPYPTTVVPVTFTVAAPAGWGAVGGTVTGVDCAGVDRPLAGIPVWLDAGGSRYALTTDPQGRFTRWLDAGTGSVAVVAGGGNWTPVSRTVPVSPGTTSVADLRLVPAGCP
ncbi:Kelch repeat-containing protein [Micromonospora sp. NBC_01796]|uniref:Kelch repeat-containing protein n=1 Tax=Micromonospora sp. NBC_01796 TaxID=2975987 RepID=UPI002DD82ACE|nr:kelch repeat-containing protein [Micromonospora sp. NBC_01796]WSA86499.1 carboxypeptidase regulatory-like domain-containing protein [Micromonospora sp. NBC_01796]